MKKRTYLNQRANPSVPKPLIGVAETIASRACSCFLDLPRPVISTDVISTTIVATATRTEPATITITSTAITSTTTTSTGPSTTTTTVSVVTVNVSYTLAAGGPNAHCAYNRYYRAVSNVQSVQDCQNACTNDPRCKFFAVDKYDPARANGFGGYECDLDDQPYDPSLLQCNLPTVFFYGYNKNPA